MVVCFDQPKADSSRKKRTGFTKPARLDRPLWHARRRQTVKPHGRVAGRGPSLELGAHRAELETLKDEFRSAHQDGMDALDTGDLDALGAAIDRERVVLDLCV